MITSSVRNKLFDLENDIYMLCCEVTWLQSLYNMINSEIFATNYNKTTEGLAMLMHQVDYYSNINFLACDYMHNIIKDIKDIEKEVNNLRKTLEPGAKGEQ